MSQAVSLDHAGIVGRDLDALASILARLGFTLTPLARHAGGRTGNRCVMLAGSYIELLATMPGGTSATLDRFIARHAGMHILAFGIDDEDAARARLLRAGIAAPEPVTTERAVDDAEPGGKRARFVLVSPPDPPEGRVHLVRHESADALWQPAFLQHRNKAIAITEVCLASDKPAVSAAYYSRLTGRPATPDPSGGYALNLPRGRLRIRQEPAVPGLPHRAVPRFAELTISTGDRNVALAACLAEHGVAHEGGTDMIRVNAGGTSLRFVAVSTPVRAA